MFKHCFICLNLFLKVQTAQTEETLSSDNSAIILGQMPSKRHICLIMCFGCDIKLVDGLSLS